MNSLADQIAKLNQQIYSYEITGNVANDLRDQRGNLVDKLSRIVNIQAFEVNSGKLPNGLDDMRFTVTQLKRQCYHFRYHIYLSARSQRLNDEDIENLYEIGWPTK